MGPPWGVFIRPSPDPQPAAEPMGFQNGTWMVDLRGSPAIEALWLRALRAYGTCLPLGHVATAMFPPCLPSCRGTMCACSVSGGSEMAGALDKTAPPGIRVGRF